MKLVHRLLLEKSLKTGRKVTWGEAAKAIDPEMRTPTLWLIINGEYGCKEERFKRIADYFGYTPVKLRKLIAEERNNGVH